MKTQVTAEDVLAEIATADLVDLCNRSLISLLNEDDCNSQGMLLLSRVRIAFIELLRSKPGNCTIDEIALTGADLFENCLPEYPAEILQATGDLIAYGELLPEGYAEHLDIIGQCELALFVIAERLWQTLAEDIALSGIFPN
jgi:hypothetical protein